MIASLIAEVALAAALAHQAPPPTPPSSQATPANDTNRAKPDPGAPPTELQDAEGNPLPPEVQRELKERLRDSVPPPKPEGAPPPAPSATALPPHEGEIIVSRQRPRGSVIGDLRPERSFDALDIDAYGASNVEELIDALGPQVTNSGGENARPVTLLNGRRVSSFAEIAAIPTEAIQRVEVFPEQLALRYGYRASQKVVNIITAERYRSRLGELGATVSTEGGYDSARALANYFAINGNTRLDLGAEYSRESSLLESERDLAQLGEVPEAGRFRTLLPDSERLKVNGLVGGSLFRDLSYTLNGGFELADMHDLFGRAGNVTLVRDTNTRAAHLATTLHGQISNWRWSLTANYDDLRSEIRSGRASATGAADRARSNNAFANSSLVLNGALLKLPAGPIEATLDASAERRDFSATSLRGGISQRANISRQIGAVRSNLNLPISSRRAKGAASLGDLSVYANAGFERLSGFGTLRTLGYGLNWSPVRALNLVASMTSEQRAPTVEQLGAPLLVTPNLRTFDFARGEVADAAWLSGGNPELRGEDRHVLRLGLNATPLAAADLTLSVGYVSTRTEHPIAPFPLLSPQIEAAFPERFTRGADGRLLQVDGRPLNFVSSDRRQLRWGVSFARPLGDVPRGKQSVDVRTYSSEEEARAAAPPGTIVTMVQPGSAMARRLENLSSRLYLSIYHTWQLRDQILIREDLPLLNLLDGGATDLLAGTRRHRLEVQGGLFERSLGARVSVNWQSGTAVGGSGNGNGNGNGNGKLTVSDLLTVNINLFANLAGRFGGSKAPAWLKGARLTFGITNLFDARSRVRDVNGSTPLSYQPAYLDPVGRFISLGLRKTF